MSTSRSTPANWWRCSGRPAPARPRCCGSSPGSTGRMPARSSFDGEDALARGAGERHVGFVFQHYALFRHMSVFENVAFGLRVQPRSDAQERGRRSARGSRICSIWCSSTGWPTAIRTSCPAASASASRWPARWRSSRASCCSTSRSARSTPRCARNCAQWLRTLHEEIHVTSIFVTHDQEEALEVANRVVVMDKGRIEQIGTPGRRLRAVRRPPSCTASSANRSCCRSRCATAGCGSATSVLDLDRRTAPAPGPSKLFIRRHDLAIGPIGSGVLEGAVTPCPRLRADPARR